MQWPSCQDLLGVHPHRLHERQGVMVGTEHQVLAIVKGLALVNDAAGAPTRLRGGFIHQHLPASQGGMDGGAEPGPAGTHNVESGFDGRVRKTVLALSAWNAQNRPSA